MVKEKLNIIHSKCVPLNVENVDTDQIIPARFLKSVSRKGFGENLFRDWRYNDKGAPKKDFILNDNRYDGKILLAGKNFGSGSSREHAAWALYDYGFRAVVSSFFADIFRNNALNNGLLPVQVSSDFLEKAFVRVNEDPETRMIIDLPEQKVFIEGSDDENFEISPYKKECLIKGYDDIDFLISVRDEILKFDERSIL